MKIYIYLLTNKLNGKRYVGQTKNIKHRFMLHFSPSKNNNNSIFSQDKKIYGKRNFKIEILEETTEEFAFLKEKEWIQKLKTFKEYNIMKSSGTSQCEINEIIENFMKGTTLVNLEKEHHTDRERISKILKEEKIDTFKNHKYRPLTEEKYQVAKKMYLQGNSLRKVAEKLHVCRKVLSKKFKEENIKIIGINENKHNHPYKPA